MYAIRSYYEIPPVRERREACRDVPVDLVVPVEDQSPGAAPRPQEQVLGNPENRRPGLREIEKCGRAARLQDPPDLAYGAREIRCVSQRVAS